MQNGALSQRMKIPVSQRTQHSESSRLEM